MEWIKVRTDLFKDEKIQIIASEKNGNEKILIWIKLLCLAGEQGGMGVFQMAGKPMNETMLAAVTGTPKSRMVDALKTFMEYGMIEQTDGFYMIPNWGKHQEVEKQEKRREDTAKRVSQFRKRQKESVTCNAGVTRYNGECNAPCNADVTPSVTHVKRDCNADVTHPEKEIEIEPEVPPLSIVSPPQPVVETVGVDERERAFDAFYALYPKQEGREQARKEWQRLSPDPETVAGIMAAVKRDRERSEWKREEGRYIPKPARYLSERRWEDQHPAREGQGEKSYDLDAFFEAAVSHQFGRAMV